MPEHDQKPTPKTKEDDRQSSQDGEDTASTAADPGAPFGQCQGEKKLHIVYVHLHFLLGFCSAVAEPSRHYFRDVLL